MKKSYFVIFLLLSVLYFYSCEDCNVNDVKVGEIGLMSTTRSFLDQFIDKTVVYVDSSGNELKFIEQDGLQRTIKSSYVRLNCNQGLFQINKSYDYIEYEWVSIRLIDTSENLTISYVGRVIDKNDWLGDTVFYDDLNPTIYTPNTCCSLSTLLIMSMRGHDNTSVIAPDPPIILDTIILNKQFLNIYRVKRNDLCCNGDIPALNLPNEFYISKKDGIMAFRMINGKMWRFERIE